MCIRDLDLERFSKRGCMKFQPFLCCIRWGWGNISSGELDIQILKHVKHDARPVSRKGRLMPWSKVPDISPDAV